MQLAGAIGLYGLPDLVIVLPYFLKYRFTGPYLIYPRILTAGKQRRHVQFTTAPNGPQAAFIKDCGVSSQYDSFMWKLSFKPKFHNRSRSLLWLRRRLESPVGDERGGAYLWSPLTRPVSGSTPRLAVPYNTELNSFPRTPTAARPRFPQCFRSRTFVRDR